jgi:hypothetical protein
MDLDHFLKTAINAQSGSFGEAVFADVCRRKGKTVVSVHEDGCDFEVDGLRVDVKSSRSVRWSLARYKPVAPVVVFLVAFLPAGECLTYAMESRSRIKQELMKLDKEEHSAPSLSYIDNEIKEEHFVEAPC